jgi:hypothetical protein
MKLIVDQLQGRHIEVMYITKFCQFCKNILFLLRINNYFSTLYIVCVCVCGNTPHIQ